MSREAIVSVTPHDDGAIVVFELNRPKGNILDTQMVDGLRNALRIHQAQPHVRAHRTPPLALLEGLRPRRRLAAACRGLSDSPAPPHWPLL